MHRKLFRESSYEHKCAKIFVNAISVIVVLFLLFNGGSMTATTVGGDMAVTSLLSTHSWIWIAPTLLIFGFGFMLAWIALGSDEVANKARNALREGKRGWGYSRRFVLWGKNESTTTRFT